MTKSTTTYRPTQEELQCLGNNVICYLKEGAHPNGDPQWVIYNAAGERLGFGHSQSHAAGFVLEAGMEVVPVH